MLASLAPVSTAPAGVPVQRLPGASPHAPRPMMQCRLLGPVRAMASKAEHELAGVADGAAVLQAALGLPAVQAGWLERRGESSLLHLQCGQRDLPANTQRRTLLSVVLPSAGAPALLASPAIEIKDAVAVWPRPGGGVCGGGGGGVGVGM